MICCWIAWHGIVLQYIKFCYCMRYCFVCIISIFACYYCIIDLLGIFLESSGPELWELSASQYQIFSRPRSCEFPAIWPWRPGKEARTHGQVSKVVSISIHFRNCVQIKAILKVMFLKFVFSELKPPTRSWDRIPGEHASETVLILEGTDADEAWPRKVHLWASASQSLPDRLYLPYMCGNGWNFGPQKALKHAI